MFLGEYKHSIDIKGRLAVPVKFRGALKKGAVVTRGLDRCLFVFQKESWKTMIEKLVSLSIARANSRAFVRLMLSGAMEIDLDSQGRMLVPDYLRSYASLTKQAVITGLYNRLEIWDETLWKKYKERTETASDEIAERLGELGII